MTKDNILDILEQARDYADRARYEAKEAQDLVSVAETQATEAYDLVDRAMSMLEENEDE